MNKLGIALLVTNLVWVSACTIIVRPNAKDPPVVQPPLTCTNDGGAPTAHIIFAMRVERTTVLLEDHYASIMERTTLALASAGILPTLAAVVRLDERPIQKPLLAAWGCNLDNPRDLPPADVINYYAQADEPEGEIGCATDPLVAAGARLSDLNTFYPQELNGVSGRSVFGSAPDLVVIVHFDERERRSAYSDTACDGAKKLSEESNGLATWLNYAGGPPPANRIVHWFYTTDEGVERAQFAARCQSLEGFPTSTLDTLEPSRNPLYTPLAAALHSSGAGHVGSLSLCGALTDAAWIPFIAGELGAVAELVGTSVDQEVLATILSGEVPPELGGAVSGPGN